MLRVPITLALPGMVLALPVRSPRRPEHILLQSGYALEAPAIPRLREMKVSDSGVTSGTRPRARSTRTDSPAAATISPRGNIRTGLPAQRA